MATPRKGLRKAALLLLSLPKQRAAVLLDRLDAGQAAAVSAEMAESREVGDGEQQAAVFDFAEASAARSGQRRPSTATPFEFLYDLDAHALFELIADEQPQTIAWILSYLPPRHAGAVLAELTPAQQFSAICRIATMRPTDQRSGSRDGASTTAPPLWRERPISSRACLGRQDAQCDGARGRTQAVGQAG